MSRSPILLTAFCLLLSPAWAQAEVRYVRAGDNLQAALNAARPGDELRLAPETTFTGNFVLPVTSGDGVITVRTDLPDEALPGARQRITPATAARFARIASPNNGAALRTAAGAHHWRLAYLEFPNNRDGFGDIIQLGDGGPAQSTLSTVPYELVLDHLYIHGHPLQGQKRGIALNARNVTIRNCYISDIKAVGADAQAIAGWNGPGAYSIENNYLEASGEVFLLGGADPSIPNLVPEDVSLRSNHMTRPLSWRDPIIAAPSGVTAVASAGGSLPGGVYAYRVAARRGVGTGLTGTSQASAEVTAVASSGAVTISWDAVPDAANYVVYGRLPSGATQSWTTTTTRFVHDGTTAGTAGTPPAEGTLWSVKNIFELKNARRVQVESNLLENNWRASQQGYAILFTPRNQDGKCPWCVVEQVAFTHNVVRNVASGFNISGYDNNAVSLQTNTLVIQDNLMYGVSTALGGAAWGFLLGDAPRDILIDHNSIDSDGTTVLYAFGGTPAAPRAITGFRFTNNAARHGQYGVNGGDASTGTLTFQMYFPNVVFTGNWLSGGISSRYPPGNRFDEPFELSLNAPAAANAPALGANVGRLVQMIDTIRRGIMAVPPQAPRNVRIVISPPK
jgi:hypothetical protein